MRDPSERAEIRQIEREEAHHRVLVLGLLEQLGAAPSRPREAVFWCIGHTISLLCRIGGWFIPMYGAGRLERSNIIEYENAAQFAAEAGQPQMIECLLEMAEVEWEHERYFRERVLGHWMLRYVPLWEAPPPKETIRRMKDGKGTPPSDAVAHASQRGPRVRPLEALVHRFCDAWNRHDVEGLARLWSPDGELQHPWGEHAVGHDAIRAMLERDHNASMAASTIRLTPRVTHIDARTATADLDGVIEGVLAPNGHSYNLPHAIYVMFVATEDDWMIRTMAPIPNHR